jgi:nucleoside-diphosphate-sugar epimerase
MTKTLLTGAPGWIGSRLVQAFFDGIPEHPSLAQPHEYRHVRVLVQPGIDSSSLPVSERLEITRGDLRQPQDLKSFCRDAAGGVLFHCAGLVHPALWVRDLYSTNVQGTHNLLAAAEAAGVRRVVVLSSNSPVGCNPRHDHLFNEQSPPHPYMNYGRSKMQMERAVMEFQSHGNMETVILRPTWFYGPNQPLRQTTFFRMIRSGRAPIVGDGENRRSMAYIDNLCQAMLLAESNPAANGQAYWIADAAPYAMNEIIDTVERLMEQEFHLPVAHQRLRLPNIAGQVAQLCDAALQALGVYQQKIHVLSEMNKTIACSIAKARQELQYSPAIALEEGMRRSLAWCLKKGIAL